MTVSKHRNKFIKIIHTILISFGIVESKKEYGLNLQRKEYKENRTYNEKVAKDSDRIDNYPNTSHRMFN